MQKRMILRFYTYIIIVTLFFTSCSDADKYREMANQLENEGRYQEAITYLEKAIEIDPLFIDAYLDRGADYSILNNYEAAIENYSKVIQIDSLNMLAHYNRAKNYYRLGSFDSAYADIKKTYSLTTHYSAKHDSMTINIYIEPFYNDKYYVPIYKILFERGQIFLKMDSLEKAYIDMNNCIIKDEELQDKAYYWRGMINMKMGNTSEGCEDLHNAWNGGVTDAKIEIEKYCK